MQDAIASLVHPVLAYGLELKDRLERGDSPAIEIEQAALKGLLLSEIESRRYAAFGGDADSKGTDASQRRGGHAFLGIRYALTCWLDEVFILDSKWSTAWNERKLEVSLYGTNDRAWKFWEQARLAEGGAGNDALEVFFLCVMLGFRGEYSEEPEQLRAWVAAARIQVARTHGQEWPYPPELEPPSNVPPLYGVGRLRRLTGVAAVVLLVLIPVLTMVLQYLGRQR
jgi:type VI secretion system protein ImpK